MLEVIPKPAFVVRTKIFVGWQGAKTRVYLESIWSSCFVAYNAQSHLPDAVRQRKGRSQQKLGFGDGFRLPDLFFKKSYLPFKTTPKSPCITDVTCYNHLKITIAWGWQPEYGKNHGLRIMGDRWGQHAVFLITPVGKKSLNTGGADQYCAEERASSRSPQRICVAPFIMENSLLEESCVL